MTEVLDLSKPFTLCSLLTWQIDSYVRAQTRNIKWFIIYHKSCSTGRPKKNVAGVLQPFKPETYLL